MREGVIGFVLGAALVAVAIFLAQRQLFRTVAPDLRYRFTACVFSGDHFPFGDIEQGRALRRAFFPVKITTRFFDGHYREVTQPDQPGRYGAVVRIALGSVVEYRFVTLYHTAAPVYWADGPMATSAVFPPGTGIDPVVLRNQAAQIDTLIRDDFSGDLQPRLAVLLCGLSETSPADPPALRHNNFAERNDAWWLELRHRLGLAATYRYLADLPQGYDTDPAKRWPLLLYLHGMGERGGDLQVVRHSGLAKVVAEGRAIPAIVISPQLPMNQDWSLPALSQLLDDAAAKYRVDPDRIGLVGVSSGGDASWGLALTYPDRFAALVVMAGEYHNDDYTRVRNLPVWVFEGGKDEAVDPDSVLFAPRAIALAGGHPHITMYPELGHNCWDKALATDAVYTWLLAQKRGQPEVVPAGISLP
jgi:predicted esterase